MEYLNVNGVPLAPARILLGSMLFGLDDMDAWFRLLDAYAAIGGNCIDTGRVYRGGQSERVIGEWLRSRKNRDQVVILTKGAHPKSDGKPRVHPDAILEDLSESLDALQTDVIDLYVLHRDDPNVPVAEIVDSLNALIESGKIRTFGASNWTTTRLEEANAYAKREGLNGFCLSSPNLSLAEPNEPRWPGCVSLTTGDLSWYEASQLPVFSWSAQAGGFFTGTFNPGIKDNPDIVRVYYSEENWRRLERARTLGASKGVDATQIALAYVLSQGFPTCAIIGPKSVEELHSSTRSADLRLTPTEVQWLDGRRDSLE